MKKERENKALCAEIAEVYGKNKPIIYEIVKKENRNLS
jgi:hypothetical protein